MNNRLLSLTRIFRMFEDMLGVPPDSNAANDISDLAPLYVNVELERPFTFAGHERCTQMVL